jgi:hypothetical protein
MLKLKQKIYNSCICSIADEAKAALLFSLNYNMLFLYILYCDAVAV